MMVVFSPASLYFLSHTYVTCVIFNVFPLLQMGRPMLTAPLAEADRAPPNTNTNHSGEPVKAAALPGSLQLRTS